MEKIIKELEQKKSEHLKEVETIDKAIKLLSKKDMSSAEKWVLENIEWVKPKTQSNGDVEWNKYGEWLFTQDFKNEWLLVSNAQIWKVLVEEFDLKDYEIHDLLIKVLRKYTDNGRLKIV